MPSVTNTSRGLPNLDKAAEVHEVAISTNSSGNGSSTVSWDEEFEGGVYAIASGDSDGDFFVSASGGSQATVEVAGSSTTSGTVNATVVAFGDR